MQTKTPLEMQKIDERLKFLAKLCLRCGIGFKDISGLCPRCKKECKRK